MTNHRTERLRVAAPTLEPDPVFLGALAELGASSQPATPRTTRTAGLRLVVATATVAAIATATWAAGAPHGTDIPLSPADGPTQQEPSGPPSHGDAGTPQPGVATVSPGSPLSPGLPGASTSGSEHASDRGRERGRGFETPSGTAPGRSGDAPRSTQGEDNGKYDEDHGRRSGDPGGPGGTGGPGDVSDERRPGPGDDPASSDLRRGEDRADDRAEDTVGPDRPGRGHGPGKVKKTR
ncbi:hypothetical protein [Nocardioides sp. LML1-1-1.1]|uniref:hypothetical protein n=1 Tax=Nocardioides sp. LML1-1-1.1 TaxID=3135248 RepID=UPI003449577D